ncbi:chaplin family protein [Arthrobacter sp. NPDC057259]|uniref:chaplin family protein n=1 Tax=Arthrobacter sp. NPDC057259 TaxID=3346073 RepID=UPI0036401580
MHQNLRRGLLGTLFAGGLLALGSTAASAADTTTTGSDGLLSGTQVTAPISIPVNLGATSLGLLGDSTATTGGTSTGTAPAAPAGSTSTTGADGILSSTQVTAPVTVPINLGATSVGALGNSTATTGGPTTGTVPAGSTSAGPTTTGADGILSGTQVTAPISAPINLGATSVGALGDSTATTGGTTTGTAPAAPTGSTPSGSASTTGADGILSGTQVTAPVTAPITVGATSVGALGDSTATTGGTTAGTAPAGSTSAGPTTTGADGILSGTQVTAPVTAPINLGATSVGALGDSTATTGSGNMGQAAAGPASGPATTGSGGILSGTQITAPISAPISLGATSVGVGGGSAATTGNPPTVTPPVVTPPVVTPPVVTPPVVTPPAAESPAAVQPGNQGATGTSQGIVSAASAPSGVPAGATTLAYTGANANALWLAGLFLGAGLLMLLGMRLKRSA